MIALEVRVDYDALHHWECVLGQRIYYRSELLRFKVAIGRISTAFNEVSCKCNVVLNGHAGTNK